MCCSRCDRGHQIRRFVNCLACFTAITWTAVNSRSFSPPKIGHGFEAGNLTGLSECSLRNEFRAEPLSTADAGRGRLKRSAKNGMADAESKILGRELGKLGGFGARWAARFLPNVAHEAVCDVTSSEESARATVTAILRELGPELPELPQFSVVFGSGQMNLNPTIVSVTVSGSSSGARIFLRGVAKEGAIKQDSAKKAVERVAALLSTRLSCIDRPLSTADPAGG